MKKSLQLILLILFFANQVNAQKYRVRKIDIPIIDSNASYVYSCALSPDSSLYFTAISYNGNTGITLKGLFRYYNGNCTFINSPLPSNNNSRPLNRICFNTANDYWVGSDSGLYHWNGNTWTVYDTLNSPFHKNSITPIKCNSLTGKSYFYTNHNNGSIGHEQICMFDGSTWTSIDSSNSPIPKYINGADVDDNGNIYFWTNDTIGIYNGTSWQFLTADSIIVPVNMGTAPIDKFTGFKLDTAGSFFFSGYISPGTDFKILKYSPNNPIKVFFDWSFSSENHFFVIDNDKNLWYTVANSNFILYKVDGLATKIISPSISFQNIYNDVLQIDNKNNIWVWTIYSMGSPANLYLFNENGFNTISGSVFIDNNSNGVKDAGELNQKNILVHETTKNLYCNSDTSGYILGLVDTSGSYNVELITPPYWTVTNSPSSYSITQTHNNEKNTGIDFGIAPIGNVNDLSINGTMFTARPGFNTMININYKNIGTTIISDTVSIYLDSNLTFNNANPAPTFVNGNYIQWVFTNLNPFDQVSINVHVTVSTSATLGSSLTTYAGVATSINDTTPLNNYTTITRLVTGSFDPNVKEVEPKGTGTTGDVPLHQQLTFTVQFQNTGNDTAFKVVIKDSIDADLDLSTFNLVGYSHPVSYKINSERLVTFTFNNILLPDSNTNELLSHGFVKYTISPLPNAVSGKQVKNVAGIYFDFNSAVETNTTLNTLSLAAGIPSVNYENNSSKVFPNPFIEQTTVSLTVKSTQLQIYDLTGRNVTSQCNIFKSGSNDWIIKNQSLKSGIYIYKVFNGTWQLANGKLNLK